MPQNLTPTEITVLQGAKDGRLYRSESIADLYASYLRPAGGGRNKKVTAVVDRITSREPYLLAIGESAGFSRPWHLTDAGQAALDDATARAKGE